MPSFRSTRTGSSGTWRFPVPQPNPKTPRVDDAGNHLRPAPIATSCQGRVHHQPALHGAIDLPLFERGEGKKPNCGQKGSNSNVEPQTEDTPMRCVVLDENGEPSEAQDQSPSADEKENDTAASDGDESDYDSWEDSDLDGDMGVVNGNVDFAEGSDPSGKSSGGEDYRLEEKERKAKAQCQLSKALRRGKQVWDAAFSEASENSEAGNAVDGLFQLSKGPATRKKVLAGKKSITWYEERLRDMQLLGKTRGCDEWAICDDDARDGKERIRRGDCTWELSRCMNCGISAHTTFECPEPMKRRACLFCDSDRHKAPRLASCLNNMCHRCLGKGHDPRRCSAVDTECPVCQTWNHTASCCTDLWRRFHQTTSGSVPVSAPMTSLLMEKCPRKVSSYSPVLEEQPVVGLSNFSSAPSSVNDLDEGAQTPRNEKEKQDSSIEDPEPRLILPKVEKEEMMGILEPPPMVFHADVVVKAEGDQEEYADDELKFLLSESHSEDGDQTLDEGNVKETTRNNFISNANFIGELDHKNQNLLLLLSELGSGDGDQTLDGGNVKTVKETTRNNVISNANLDGKLDHKNQNQSESRNGSESWLVRDLKRRVEGEDVIHDVQNVINIRSGNMKRPPPADVRVNGSRRERRRRELLRRKRQRRRLNDPNYRPNLILRAAAHNAGLSQHGWRIVSCLSVEERDPKSGRRLVSVGPASAVDDDGAGGPSADDWICLSSLSDEEEMDQDSSLLGTCPEHTTPAGAPDPTGV